MTKRREGAELRYPGLSRVSFPILSIILSFTSTRFTGSSLLF